MLYIYIYIYIFFFFFLGLGGGGRLSGSGFRVDLVLESRASGFGVLRLSGTGCTGGCRTVFSEYVFR